MKADKWILVFAAVMFILPLIFVASSLEPYACGLQIVKDDIQGGKAANCFEFWVNRYQSLGSGILALSAAAVAYWAANAQIRHAERLEEKRRQAEEFAARAGLSFALNDILSYTNSCLEKCKSIYFTEGISSKSELIFPSLPPSSIESLKKCIQFSSEQNQQKIQNLVSFLQIIEARLADLNISVVLTQEDELNLCRKIIDLLTIRYFASSLFEYARIIHEQKSMPDATIYIWHELRKAGFSDVSDGIIYSLINKDDFSS